MTPSSNPQHESHLLIDGKLVDAARAGRSTTSTRPPRRCIGVRWPTPVAADMDAAIAAARSRLRRARAGPPTASLPQAVPACQLQEALESEQEELREPS